MRLAVVGGGVAGATAAHLAARRGASVTLFDAGVGASALTSGAVDLLPWERAHEPEQLDSATMAFVDALGAWRVDPEHRAWVCTAAGVLRPARGRDAALLDVAGRPGARVAVARVDREGWDADAIAASLADERAARRLGVSFFAVDVAWLRERGEASLPPGDFAALLDGPARVAWAAARVTEARRRAQFDALLVGPWLGAGTSRAEELSRAAGVDVGEVLSPIGGPAGERLVRALHGVVPPTVERVRARVQITATPRSVAVRGPDGVAQRFDACVLAAGGVAAGSIVLCPPDPTIIGGPPAALRSVAWTDGAAAPCASWEAEAWQLEAPLPPLGWTSTAGSPLERAGVMHHGGLALGPDRAPLAHVAVAGDHAFGVPRTLLGAVVSAARAVGALGLAS